MPPRLQRRKGQPPQHYSEQIAAMQRLLVVYRNDPRIDTLELRELCDHTNAITEKLSKVSTRELPAVGGKTG